MAEPRKACVVLIRNEDGSFGIMDACGQLVEAQNLDELGAACGAVLDRDDLPKVTTPSPMQIHMESAIANATEYMGRAGSTKAQALLPLLAPALKGVTNGVLRRRQKTKSNERQQERDAEHGQSRAERRRRLLGLRGVEA